MARSKKPMNGGVEIYAAVDASSVELLLDGLNTALSPSALAHFLGIEVFQIFQERAEHRFLAEGDDASGKWDQLKPSTWKIRGKAGFPPQHPINKRTGELEAYITGGNTPDARPLGIGARLDFPGRSAPNAGSTEIQKKMETAQRGRKKPETVARPVLAINETDLEMVLSALALHTLGANP